MHGRHGPKHLSTGRVLRNLVSLTGDYLAGKRRLLIQ